MDFNSTLNPETLNTIALQIGEFMGHGIYRFEKAHNLQLAEAFPVWILPASEVYSTSLSLACHSTGYWDFQIHNSDEPIAFATAKFLGPSSKDWQLSSVFESELSTRLDKAISIIDQLSVAGEARILEVPAWLIKALWMSDSLNENHVYVIYNAPIEDDVPLLQPLSEERFFSVLRMLPVVNGLIS